MAYVRKIRTSQSEGPADKVSKIKILNDGAVVDIKKSLYCDSNLNLIEIYNINPYYTVSFKYIKDNETTPTTISTLILEKGKTIPTVPAAPNMVGWIFSHWLLGEKIYTETEIKSTTVDSDLTFIAYYTPQTFTVDYYNNQEFLVQKRVNYNDRPITDITTLGVTPTSPEIGYTKEFIGWSLSNNNEPFDFTNYQTKGHLVLYACFSKTPINYTIIFYYKDIFNTYVEISRKTAKINDNIFELKPERPIRYLIGYTSTYIYTNNFYYYKGSNSSALASSKLLTSEIISVYATDTIIKLSLNHTEIPHSAPVLSSYSGITPINMTPVYRENPLVYFKNKFIAGGKGKVYYNDNPKGKAWSVANLPHSEVSICGFAHTNDRIVGFTNSNAFLYHRSYPQLVYSNDGLTWYEVNTYFGNNEPITCITTFNNTNFILSTIEGMVYVSTNGIDWVYHSTVGAGFNASNEEIWTLTVTKNNILIVGTNKNKSYFTQLDGSGSWNKLPDLDSSVISRSTFLMSIPTEGDATLGRVLWLKNYGSIFELRPTGTPPYVEWVKVSYIFNSTAYQNGFIYHNNRYFAVGESGSYAHTPNINLNWRCNSQGSNYNFSSIAANNSYVVMLADDANNPNVKQVFTVDWREAYALPIHTLMFNTQGESSIEPIINVNKIPESLPIPTKAGYTFLGWQFYDETYGYWDAGAGDDIFADTTLYAKWKPNT